MSSVKKLEASKKVLAELYLKKGESVATLRKWASEEEKKRKNILSLLENLKEEDFKGGWFLDAEGRKTATYAGMEHAIRSILQEQPGGQDGIHAREMLVGQARREDGCPPRFYKNGVKEWRDLFVMYGFKVVCSDSSLSACLSKERKRSDFRQTHPD